MKTKRNETVEVTPAYTIGGRIEPAVMGTVKTVCGVRVVEVHAGYYYQSVDGLRTATRRTRANRDTDDEQLGWMVSESAAGGACSDGTISTKGEALRLLADVSAW